MSLASLSNFITQVLENEQLQQKLVDADVNTFVKVAAEKGYNFNEKQIQYLLEFPKTPISNELNYQQLEAIMSGMISFSQAKY